MRKTLLYLFHRSICYFSLHHSALHNKYYIGTNPIVNLTNTKRLSWVFTFNFFLQKLRFNKLFAVWECFRRKELYNRAKKGWRFKVANNISLSPFVDLGPSRFVVLFVHGKCSFVPYNKISYKPKIFSISLKYSKQ